MITLRGTQKRSGQRTGQRTRLRTRRTKIRSRVRSTSQRRKTQKSPLFLVQALNTLFLDVSTFAQKQGKVYYPMSADEFFQELQVLFAFIGKHSRTQMGGSFSLMSRTAEFFRMMRDTEYLTTAVGGLVGSFETPCDAIISSIWLLSYAAMAYNAVSDSRATGSIRQVTNLIADPVKATILKYFEDSLSFAIGTSKYEQLVLSKPEFAMH
jgi:hypothetical protein